MTETLFRETTTEPTTKAGVPSTATKFTPERIYLVGMPASGKSRIGKLLAHVLGVEHWDTDKLIEENAEQEIPAIFQEKGESEFRRLEVEAVRSSQQLQGVISLGGGAVETPEIREILRQETVVWIYADQEELLQRIARHPTRRPLLKDDPETTLRQLAERRHPLFAEVADLQVKTDSGEYIRVVNQILKAWWNLQAIRVEVDNPYCVLVGDHAIDFLPSHMPTAATKTLVIAPEALQAYARQIGEQLVECNLEVHYFFHENGEIAKSYERAIAGWNILGQARLTRQDLIVSVGGGVTSDLAGFLAATWLRGIKVAHVSTTLLGMVDAAVGGKTGIDTPAGKNLVGAFHDPILVIADTPQLATLPPAEFSAGLAEAIKCGFIADTTILELIADHPQILKPMASHEKSDEVATETAALRDQLHEVIARAIHVKANVVGQDKFEAGLREILNYGHTLGHAIERAEHYQIRHGEAVSIGCVFAAELSHHLGFLSEEEVALHREMFTFAGLPIEYRGAWSVLSEGMYSDKKTRANNLRFVLLEGIGNPQVHRVSEADLKVVAPRVGIDTNA